MLGGQRIAHPWIRLIQIELTVWRNNQFLENGGLAVFGGIEEKVLKIGIWFITDF